MKILALLVVAVCAREAIADKPKPVAPAKLTITKIDPAVGDPAGGTYSRVFGSDFVAHGARNAKVYYGATQGEVIRFASDTELIVSSPPGKVGDKVDIVIMFEPGGDFRLPAAFTFKAR